MKRYKYTKLRNLGPVNGFVIHTPNDRKLKDTHPQTIVREFNRLNDRINQLETKNKVANDMFKKLNIHALNLTARIKRLEEAGDGLEYASVISEAGEDPNGFEKLLITQRKWRKAKEAKL